MSNNRTLPIMLFVLGLFLVGIGIMLMMVNETRVTTTNFYGFPMPTGTQQVYPYTGVGLAMIIFGGITLAIGLTKSQTGKNPERPEANKPLVVEQEPPIMQ